ncbi:MAG: helix-turn-helix transcriptional regulator [Actinomycetota bacterium]|nr:helix-turn-helix transcriptional regulator [Actinomycetota bacterium]
MDSAEDLPTIGGRILELRRGVYSQIDLATAADVSVDVIRKLEQGRRQTASIGTLQRIARVLDVDIGDLLGRSRPVPSGGEHQARVLAIRDALTSVDDLLGELDDADAPDLAELGRSLTYGWGAYWAGRYGPLAAMLPRLLAEARAATHGAAAPGGGRVADLAAQVHQLAAGTLLRLGAADLGHVAARESLRLAAMASDPLREAAMRSTMTYVLIRQGRFTDAERVAVATAVDVQPSGDATTPELLRGATAAARDGRAGAAATLLGEAGEMAGRTGVDRTDYEMVFGPSNWVMQSADVAVVGEDYPAAVAVARRMPPGSALPLAARSRHLTDVVHAQLRLGNDRAAEAALLTLERGAPDWTVHHRLPRMLVGELLTRRRPSVALRELAGRLGVTPGTTTLHPSEE